MSLEEEWDEQVSIKDDLIAQIPKILDELEVLKAIVRELEKRAPA